MNAKILTLDAGTTSMKCTLFDTNGQPLSSAVSSYGVDIPESGWAEQPVDRLFEAAVQVVQEVVSHTNPRSIVAIGLSGAMNSCIPIDSEGNALYPNILPSDTRATEEVEQIRRAISDLDYYERTGNRIDVHYSLAKMLWVRNHLPEIYQKTRWFIHTKDALYGFLTGRYGISDYSDASLTGALSITRGRWDEALLNALGLDILRLPQLRVSHDVEGHLTRSAGRMLGLRGGIPVTVGGGDGACAAHGAGVCNPGDTYCNLGNSAWLSALSDVPVIDRYMRVFNYFDMDGRRYNVCGSVQCASSALEWAAKQILTGKLPRTDTDFAALEALAERSIPGAQGLFFLPALMGEQTPWWDPHARGALVGMSMHHTRADIARSVYEGVAQALRLCGDVLFENGLKCDTLSMIGGGTQSSIWPQMFADIFDIPTRVHRHPTIATSLGAAMAAGVGIEMFPDYADARRMTQFPMAHQPVAERYVAYLPHFAIYRSIYRGLRDVYQEITAYQQSKFGKKREERED